MQISAAGNNPPAMPLLPIARIQRQHHHGFSLLELLVVISIIAVATAGATLALRDNANATLEREGVRLAALLEAGRAQSRASGVPVRWHSVAGGFQFEGLPTNQLPQHWLSANTQVRGDDQLLLGPEPLIAPQSITLVNTEAPQSALRIATDGLRPFAVQATNP